MNKKLNYKLCITILILLLIVFAISSMLIGRYSLSAQDSFKILMSKMGISNINKTWTDLQESVITTIRMPRVLTAIFVGAGLSVAGASFQGIFHNPLVSPGYTRCFSISRFRRCSWYNNRFTDKLTCKYIGFYFRHSRCWKCIFFE